MCSTRFNTNIKQQDIEHIKHKASMQSILRKTQPLQHTTQKLVDFSIQQEEPLVVLGMAIAFSGCVVLCAINSQLISNITLQSLTSAAFAVFAAILYLLYMIISRMVALVLQHIDYRQHHVVATNEPLLALEEEDAEEPAKIPREALISSMYLGGSGAFLAIPPLCMWCA